MNAPTEGARYPARFPDLLSWMVWISALLAAAASVLAVISSSIPIIRLAVVLAGWAFLLGAFVAHKARREARQAEQRQTEARLTYELELQREVHARREYERQFTDEVRREMENRTQIELRELRDQLDRLNTTLTGLFDGELLIQRLTLSAESTTVRSLPAEGRRVIPAQRPAELGDAEIADGDFSDGDFSDPEIHDAEVVDVSAAAVADGTGAVAEVSQGAEPDAESTPSVAAGEPEASVEVDPGDHAKGLSVADLLAVYGAATPVGVGGRRRRRADDD